MGEDKGPGEKLRFAFLAPMLPVVVIGIAIVTAASRIERKLFGSRALEPLAKAHPQVWADALLLFANIITVGLIAAGLLWVSLSPT